MIFLGIFEAAFYLFSIFGIIGVILFGLGRVMIYLRDYDPNHKIATERLKIENERLKLENEEKRALIESLRKQEGIGGTDKIYGRVEY